MWEETLMTDIIASPRSSNVESVSILNGHHGFQANFKHCILIPNNRITTTCCRLTKVRCLVTPGEDYLSPFDSKSLPRALPRSLSNSEYVYHQSQGRSSSSNGTNWAECLHVDGSVDLSAVTQSAGDWIWTLTTTEEYMKSPPSSKLLVSSKPQCRLSFQEYINSKIMSGKYIPR